MPIPIQLSFVGTGKPVRVNINPRVNREPARKGIQFSGVESKREFNQTVKSELRPSNEELGRKAVNLQKSLGISVNVTI